MQRVNRLKFIILATIACAVLFCIAAFSVSWAKWDDGDNSTVEINSRAANFYVEYPQYITTGTTGGEDVVVPQLKDNTYYLQVPQQGNKSMSDYYEFQYHETTQKKLRSVYLYPGDVLDLFYGKVKTGIANNDSGSNTTDITYNSGTKKYTVKSEGFYDFYYKDFNSGSPKMYVGYVGKPDDSDTGPKYVAPTRPSGERSVKVTFNDGPIVFVATNHDWTENDVYFHIWQQGGATTEWPGLKLNKKADSADNTIRLKCDSSDITGIIISCKDGRTGDHGYFFNEKFPSGLQAYYKYTININNLHDYKEGHQTFPQISVSATAPQTTGGTINEANNRTAADADFVGSTEFNANASSVENTVKPVRTVRAVYNAGSDTYTYQNFICVSRKNSDATTDDNTIVYLEFRLQDYNINPYNLVITSLSLTRRATDDKGNIKNDTVKPAPRLYNYDQTVETRLGPDSSSNNNTTYPVFAHGNKVSGSGNNMKTEFYDDGAYVILYFGDDDQQYFALDINIEFKLVNGVNAPTDGIKFTLIADANNINDWDRYNYGYGEPWGFYMGGLINGVKLWEPSRTTKLNPASDEFAITYDAATQAAEKTALGTSNPDTAAADKITAFNANSSFNYKIIKYSTGVARYPKEAVDLSLTVNLTENTRVKMYMLDDVGCRLDVKNGETVTHKNKSIYIVPNEVIYDPITAELFADETNDILDNDLNTIIPKTGTYVFRLTGYFHTGDEAVVDSNGVTRSGNWFRLVDGKRLPSNKVTETGDNTGKGKDENGNDCLRLPEYNLIVERLYVTCASEGKSTCHITLNANGGTFDDGKTTREGDVLFGSDLTKLSKPIYGGDSTRTPIGWYYEVNGVKYDFELGSTVTEDLVLYAKWAYYVTLDVNGVGALPNGTTNPAITNKYGRLPAAQMPTLSQSGYSFDGWFTESTGGDKVTVSTVFTDDGTIYAHWTKLNYTITFHYNYDDAPDNGVYATQLTKPTDPSLAGHTFGGWYTTAACTTQYTDFSQNLTGNKDLYAKWTGASYSINGTMKAFDKFSGTHGVNTEDESYTYIDTRTGAYSTGKLTIKVYYDGKALTNMEETNSRVKHTEGSDTYTIDNAAAASCKGAFKIGAHRYQKDGAWGNYANIAFKGGDAIDETSEATGAGWYVVGQFSDWKLYNANKMAATNVEGIYSKTLNFVISGDKYKIVYVATNGGSKVWYATNGSTASDAANMEVTSASQTFYADEFKKGTSSMYPTATTVSQTFRIVLNTSGWTGSGSYYHVHAWNNDSDTTTWGSRPQMTRVDTSTLYYHDFSNKTYTNLIFTKSTSQYGDDNGRCQTMITSPTKGKSYRFNYNEKISIKVNLNTPSGYDNGTSFKGEVKIYLNGNGTNGNGTKCDMTWSTGNVYYFNYIMCDNSPALTRIQMSFKFNSDTGYSTSQARTFDKGKTYSWTYSDWNGYPNWKVGSVSIS